MDNEEFGDFGNWDGDDPRPPEIDTRLNAETRELLRELGIEDFGEIIIDFEGADLTNLRGDRFASLQEVVLFLYDLGILQFSHVVFLPENLFGYIPDDETPKRKRK